MNFVNRPRKRKVEKPREPSPCSRCGTKLANLKTRYIFADGEVLCEKCYERFEQGVAGSQEGSNPTSRAANYQDLLPRSEIGRELFKGGAFIECGFSELEVRVLAEAQENLRRGGDKSS